MLVAPKTIAPLFTLQNAIVRFDIGEGVDFNWIGLAGAQFHNQDDTRVLFNVCDLWEVVLVEATRDPRTERYKTVTPNFATCVVVPGSDSGATWLTLTWDDMLVDGLETNPALDRLKVVVVLELRSTERFLRARIDVAWKQNNPSTAAQPGRYSVWRVRFPIVDVTPAFANSFSDEVIDGELEDVLFVPENHGVLVRGATTNLGDANLGMWAPQERSELLRNVIRPGSEWRQGHPGKAGTQVMGYYGEATGRGLLVGSLDRLGRTKDLCAAGTEDSVRMSMLQMPRWSYSLGNRPNAFTGALDGDSNDGRDALPSNLPQSSQDLPELTDDVPNSRDLETDGQRELSDTNASAGLMKIGRDQLGTQDTLTTNTLADLGFKSEFDIVIAPTKGFGPQGWNATAITWRDMAERPDSAFPLQDLKDDGELPAAAAADVLLGVDTTIHDGQESLIGTDEAGFASALPDRQGVVIDPQAVRDLIIPREIIPERAAVNDIEIFGVGDLIFEADLLGLDGEPADIYRQARSGSSRGYVQLFGKPSFYIEPEQVLHNDWFGEITDLGRLRFKSFVPQNAGVQIGDYVHVISHWDTFDPYVGRANVPVATDSELYPTTQDHQVRIVMAFGVSPGTIVVGQYVAGELVPAAFSNAIANSVPGFSFEVEVLREELNCRLLSPSITGKTVRAQINIGASVVGAVYPSHAMAWAEVIEIDEIEYTFKRLFVTGDVAYVEFDSGGKVAATFAGKAARIRRRFAPLDLFMEQVTDGDHILFGGVSLNERVRKLDLDEPWATDEAKLANGWLEFARPLVDEPAGDIPFEISIFDSVPAANRLLDASIDIEGGGFRFVDTSLQGSVAGGFGSLVIPGDLILITNSVVEANQAPFEVAEVLGPDAVRVTRQFSMEADPGGGFTYRVVRPAKSFRDANFGGRKPQDLVTGPRRLLLGGQDRIHFLQVGYLVDPEQPVTGVFGVDSSAWGDLGANPFVPADSINLTQYAMSEWGTRKPSQEFPITAYQDGRFTMSKAWAFESPNFSVEFSDIGVTTFQMNVLQYRVVRDLRADTARNDFAGTKPAIDLWKTALEATAVLAVIRGWQPKIRGFDRPDFTPSRGKYKELISALAAAGHVAFTAVDIHGLDLDDEDRLSETFNLIAAAYWNRFGTQTFEVEGDEAVPEQDRIAAPVTPFARKFLLQRVLEPLMDEGVSSFLMDGVERAFRDDYGSPRFSRPLSLSPGSPTHFELSPNGGSESFADGWRRVMDAAKVPFGATQPMDWILGPSSFSSKDWAQIDREFPTSMIPFPVNGDYRGTLSGASVVGRTLFIPGVDFRLVSAVIYGQEMRVQPGDFVKLWPDQPGFMEVESVDVGLTMTGDIDLSGQDQWSIELVRRVASNRIAAAPFFRFAFGQYATVAADVTFLASDLSWQEFIQQRGTGIDEETYQEAIVQAFGRSLYRIGANSVAGMLPSLDVTSEASRRVPVDRYGLSWTQSGTNTLIEQSSVLFRESGKSYPLIQIHANYIRYLAGWARAFPEFFRYGPCDAAPPVVGATSLLVREISLSTIGEERDAVVAGAFRNPNGDVLRVFTNWSAAPFAPQKVESIDTAFNFADLGITSGYWTVVEVRRGLPNVWLEDLANIDDDPDTVFDTSLEIRPLELKALLYYEQKIIIRRDELANEVDRVLIVPAGRSVAAAFQVIADDAGAGEDRYVVVVGAGAIADGLDVPDIPGATIELQSSTDENPTIGEIS